jgi:DNA-binding FrmR family transcriptional regulator
MPPLMSDALRADVLKRLACLRGHLHATTQMVERGDNDLAIVHQLYAVRGALTQIQVRLLRGWLAEQAERLQQPDHIQQVERDLREMAKSRR